VETRSNRFFFPGKRPREFFPYQHRATPRPAKLQNNFPDTSVILQKQTDIERWNLQAADFQTLPCFSRRESCESPRTE
jgi:hypothetical protein